MGMIVSFDFLKSYGRYYSRYIVMLYRTLHHRLLLLKQINLKEIGICQNKNSQDGLELSATTLIA